MEPVVNFLIPYWGHETHRRRAYTYVRGYIREHFEDLPHTVEVGESPGGRAPTLNFLASTCSGSIIVVLDADTVPTPSALQDSIDHVHALGEWVLPYTTYYNLTERGSRDLMDSPPWEDWRPEDKYDYEYVFPGPDPVDRPPAVSGCVVVSRVAWNEVKGFDQRFNGWGGEDRAFVYSLETLIGDSIRYPSPIYHLWHPTDESERFGNPNWVYNQKLLARYQEVRGYGKEMRALVNER